MTNTTVEQTLTIRSVDADLPFTGREGTTVLLAAPTAGMYRIGKPSCRQAEVTIRSASAAPHKLRGALFACQQVTFNGVGSWCRLVEAGDVFKLEGYAGIEIV